MENKKEYLNEEHYYRVKRLISFIALIVLLLGIIGGSVLIRIGISNKNNIDVASIKAQKNAEFFEHGFSDKYYELESQLYKAESSGPFFILGGFIIIASCMISCFMFLSTKKRELLAYQTQQIRPIAEEGIEKMAPSAGIAAKEIAKGFKEGLTDDNRVYCKHCGAQIDSDSNFCKKCGKKL